LYGNHVNIEHLYISDIIHFKVRFFKFFGNCCCYTNKVWCGHGRPLGKQEWLL